MSGAEILLTIILVVLVVIAAELAVLVREMPKRYAREPGEKDAREITPPGQTINVNLSPVQAAPADAGKATVERTPEKPRAGADEGSHEREREREAEEKAAIHKPVSTGPFAVKCPKCGAENSSYRSECFNCGSRL